jgi:outer membrane lipase/esterase
MMFKRLRTLVAPLLVSLPLFAAAGPFTNMYVFGDSLSDTGNLSIATGGFYPAAGTGQPYAPGRFSNGPLWVEGLAAGLGLAADAAPFQVGGKNFAFAGARTGNNFPVPPGEVPGVLLQAGGLWAPMTGGIADPNALYVVVGGGNDMRDARSLFQTGSAADDLGRLIAAGAAITNLGNTVGFLAASGAKHVLISNLPDLGFTPEAAFLGLVAASSDVSAKFNALIGSLLALEGAFPGLDIDLLDMAGLSATAHAGNTPGIVNTSLPCNGFFGADGGFGTVGASCNQSLFSDALHPSAVAHALIAREALLIFGIPEPESLGLFAMALVALMVARRRQGRKIA